MNQLKTRRRRRRKVLGEREKKRCIDEKDGWTSHNDESNAPMPLHFILFFPISFASE
jgi:hypothetical protein